MEIIILVFQILILFILFCLFIIGCLEWKERYRQKEYQRRFKLPHSQPIQKQINNKSFYQP